ncbi:MAG TPA: tetratricopeptide repeat protein [Pyrinomonadaceae bacterium]|nr:tetratricopeptide repeat protein [Pyrinomonadaceae bacterium]
MLRSTRCLFVLAWLLIFLPSTALAQSDMDPSLPGSSFEITGQVTSPDGRKQVQFVDVRLQKGGSLVDQRTTDSNGRFRFSRLMPGQYMISASSAGFKVAPQQIDITRFIPRVHLLLQLVPEAETFARPKSTSPKVVNASVPEKARNEFEKARAALANQKVDEAITRLQSAVSLYRDYYEAYVVLGTVYMDQSNWDKAQLVLSRAVEISPTAVEPMVSLGEVYRRQKKYAEAEKVLQGALKLDDRSWLGHYTLGRIYWEKNDLVNAGKQIGATIQLEPDFPDARAIAGNIFVRARMPENAIIEYEEYLRLAPKGQFATEIRELVKKLKSLTHQNQKKP